MKIAVLGYSGSGKSTTARILGERLGLPVLHLDTVQFTPGWAERDRDEAREIVRRFMQQPDWVIDGNYPAFFLDERLASADRILLLEFNRLTRLVRVIRRYLYYRGTTRADMAPGCPEKIDRSFVWWVVHQDCTGQNRARLRAAAAAWPDKALQLRTQRQLDRFLAAV